MERVLSHLAYIGLALVLAYVVRRVPAQPGNGLVQAKAGHRPQGTTLH
jgi:hypothetical protein